MFEFVPGTPFFVGGPVFRLKEIKDRNGNLTTLAYDAAGRLLEVKDTYGNKLILGYNSQNKLITITEPPISPLSQRVTTLTYDPTGRKLIKITDPEGKSVQYSYNTLYQITRKEDKDGFLIISTKTSNRSPSATAMAITCSA